MTTRWPPERVLAVDSGGSGLRVRHLGGDRVVELPGVAWSSGDVPAGLAAGVAEAWAGLGRPACTVVALGIAATPVTDAEVARLARPLCEAVGATDVLVANDALTAHLGALDGGWGVSLVVGTGVACLAVPPGAGGTPTVVDGYGHLIGDLGSAFWIGRRSVRAALDAAAAGQPITAVGAAVVERLGPLDDLPYRLHASATAVADLAQLAPAVADLVDRDACARDVMERAARHLATTAGRGVRVLATDLEVPVALGGRVLTPGGWLAGRVTELLEGSAARVAVRPWAGTPLDGAARLATGADRPEGVRHWSTEGER